MLAAAEERSSAYRAAEMALIDDVIHPAETRRVLIEALSRARGRIKPGFKASITP